MILPYNKEYKERARELRKNATEAERRLWSRIRMHRLKGYAFTRQKILGDYIVDFYCPRANLVIEVDGGHHHSTDGRLYDVARDNYLKGMGLKTIRFDNTDIMNNIENVIKQILDALPDPNPLWSPFQKGDKRS